MAVGSGEGCSRPGAPMIQGLITARHVFLHAPTIVRQFGAAVWLRCWRAILQRRRTTFLECVFPSSH